LLSDNIKWVLSKEEPKKFGDKVSQEISGPDGGPLEFKGSEAELDAQIKLRMIQLGYLKEEGK
jgi:hypothetical protein